MFQWRVICYPCCTNDTDEDNFVRSDANVKVCLLKLFFIVPLYCVLTISSAYYIGLNRYHVRRPFFQKCIIRIRAFVALLLTFVPIVFTTLFLACDPLALAQVDILFVIVECFAWISHFSYVLCLQKRYTANARGPVFMCFTWCLLFVFQVLLMKYVWDVAVIYNFKLLQSVLLAYSVHIVRLVLFAIYGLTLLPGKNVDPHHYRVDSEYTNLLSNTEYLGVAMESASFFSKLNFSWVSSLIRKGEQCQLQQVDDLFDLPHNLASESLGIKLEKAVKGNFNNVYVETNTSCDPEVDVQIRPQSVFRSLHSVFGLEYYSIGFLKLLAEISNFVNPLLLNMLLNFIETNNEHSINGYLYAGGLVFSVVISSYVNTHYDFRMSIVCLKIRSSLSSAIYSKLLRVSSSDFGSKLNSGEVLNFISTDVDRIVNACPSFHAFWSCPLQIIVILYLLYCQVGLIFVVGLTASIVLIILNKMIANVIGGLSNTFLKRKDERVRLITEVLRGFKVLKYNLWEKHFLHQISAIRNSEIKVLKHRKYLDALCVYFWATSSVTITFFTIITYVLWGHNLTAATVFTTIALLNMLIAPLNSMPWVFFGLVELWISLKRIQKLFDVEDQNVHKIYSKSNGDYDVMLSDVDFSWQKDLSAPPFLKSLDIKIKKGELVGIVGPTGCGKSSILMGILAELTKINGDIFLNGYEDGVGYVGQQVWLQRRTIRDNIVFGTRFDDVRYYNVLKACCLLTDLQALQNGDSTNIGEEGTLLSGGQKVRVALARAVYQDKQIYLFDDILSAVDFKVAKELLDKCFGTFLKDKTIIMTTNRVEFLSRMGRIIEIKKNGTIGNSECFENVSYTESEEDGVVDNQNQEFNDMADGNPDESELQSQGALRWSILRFYIKNIGYGLTVYIILSIMFMQLFRNLCDWYLSDWIDNAKNAANTNVNDQYIRTYVVLVVLNSVVAILRAFVFAYGNLNATKHIHECLLRTVLRAKISFFDTQPIGRILNRFSSDTITIDDYLPFIMNILLASFFLLLGSAIVTICSMPLILILFVPLYPVYHYLQNRYRMSSRELKRLSSITLSPIYSHFSETCKGLTTIRAFKSTQRFIDVNNSLIDDHIKAQFSSQALSRWLSLQLQKIGILLICGVCTITLVQNHIGIGDAGLIALAITYTLNITSVLGAVISSFVETEREMISVERIHEYIENVPIERMSSGIIKTPFGWPSLGVVTFKDVVFKHRDNIQPSLNGITFETRPAEKIGIIGRTGAGKSSLMAALYRFNELESGTVFIDNVNIANISLSQLRSRISIVPQEQFIFSASIRANIDPLSLYRDIEIWQALEKLFLDDKIQELGGLDATIDSCNTKLSVGQRQLLCLARIILKNTKIVCFDEATANIDYNTDSKIEKIIRNVFSDKTVLTIAHRCPTVIESDRILVIEDGRVIEFDTPDNLLNDKNSYFYKSLWCDKK